MTDSRWERVAAQEIRRGDQIARTRNEEPSEVIDIGPVSQKARWITCEGGAIAGRIRPKHETKFWRRESEPTPAPSLAGAVTPPPGHPGFSPEVQDALHSAGMSRNSELEPEQLERAEKLASGEVKINREDPRREYIMAGERSPGMGTGTGKRTRSSETQKGLEAAVKVLKAARKPLGRREIHEKAVKAGVDLGMKPSGTPKLGGIVNEAKAAGTVVDGYVFTNPERGKYSVKKAPAKAAAKASTTKASSPKKGAAKKGGTKKS